MSLIPDTHPDTIPILPAAREEPSGLGYRQPENLGARGDHGSAEVGLNPPSPDFPTRVTHKEGSHLENDLHEDKVAPIVWSGDEPSPDYVRAKGPVHFKP